VIEDGSGRSLSNRASAAMMTAVLRRMNNHPQRKEWWESMASPGDGVGTLRRRMKDIPGRVYAKTGHIEGVSALSGYVIGRQREVYVFSILCNDKGKAKVAPNDFQDNICRTLANWGPAPAAKEPKGG
jgi:serine-type D-Ala-D-Ala carboxypeptidase/endopeptidase (penicillin-binding protein 4)